MAKVLIAGIGGGKNKKKGEYDPTVYSIDGITYKDEENILTSVLKKHYQIDKIIYIGTTGSMWDNLYEFHCRDIKEAEYDQKYHLDLMEAINDSNMDTDVKTFNLSKFNETFKGEVIGIVTKYGMNEIEIFENFNLIIQLQDELKDGDEIYLDITHSFRSNAFWMFLVMNYLTDVANKNIKVKAITYGMYEAKKDNITPVVDLNAFYKILQWIKGANAFKEYGNSYTLLEDIENEDLRAKMENLSNALNMNYIASLRDSINSLKKMESQLNNLEGPAALLIPKVVKDFLKTFDVNDKDYIFQAKLAKWHFEEKRYAMAAININEAIINFVMNIFEFEKSKKASKANDCAKEWLDYVFKSCGVKGWKEDKVLFEYGSIYDNTKKMRNDIAHSLGKKNLPLKDIQNLEKYCNKILSLLNNEKEVYHRDYEYKFSEMVLLKK